MVSAFIVNGMTQAHKVRGPNGGHLVQFEPAAFGAPSVGAGPPGRNTAYKEPLCAEKDRPGETSQPVKMPKERTKRVLMNSGPKSGGVAGRHEEGEKLFSAIPRKVRDETARQGASSRHPCSPPLNRASGETISRWTSGRTQL